MLHRAKLLIIEHSPKIQDTQGRKGKTREQSKGAERRMQRSFVSELP